MQPVNDDMDNLFRQAAEHYPLSSHGADFGKVLQQLGTGGTPPPPEKKRRRFLWLLLLLVPIPFIYEHRHSASIGTKNTGDQQTISITKTNTSTTPGTSPSNTIASNPNPLTGNNTTGTNSNTSSLTTTQNTSPQPGNTTNTTQGVKTAGTSTTNGKTIAGKQDYRSKISIEKSVNVSVYSSAIANRNIDNKNQQKGTNTNVSSGKEAGTNLPVAIDENGIATSQPNPTTATPFLADSSYTADSAARAIARQADTSKQAVAQAQKAMDSTIATTKKKNEKNSRKPNNYFYVGAVAGTDISTVKSADTHGLGYNIGFVAGYRLGKHLGIESGLIWNYKKYYADGQYVSTEKLGLLTHTMVLNIDGSCGMLEIPLSVQYHFGNTGGSHFYAAAGLSSYLMKKEEYYYLYKRYNTQYYAEKEYKNSTQNWFSVLQLGAGYQIQLGKKSTLRFEPYVKLPM